MKSHREGGQGAARNEQDDGTVRTGGEFRCVMNGRPWRSPSEEHGLAARKGGTQVASTQAGDCRALLYAPYGLLN